MAATALKVVPVEATEAQLLAAVRVYTDLIKQHSYAELYRAMVAEAPAKSAFRVSVSPLKASNGTTHLVCIDRWDRHEDAMPWDEGRMHPFESAVRERTESEAVKWAAFLGTEFVPNGE